MKLAALGAVLAVTLAAGGLSPAAAFHDRDRAVGAPLYAEPNTVIIQNGQVFRPNGAAITRPSSGYQSRIIINGRHYDDRYKRGYTSRTTRTQRLYVPGVGWVTRYVPERHQPYPRNYGYGSPGYYGNHNHDPYPRLTILGATYRSIDGRACDAFSRVHRECDGTSSCSVRASNNICGDPDRGRLKVLEIAYACGNRQLSARAPEKSRARLSCR
jgi:hypothetical protein